ncbi:Dabb family protein [Epibacterium sp. SM1979]|uniref:Dabb family protein n=1 Tax=Tritonibacter litoralis TaxID=2662264 RepID=A0A843YL44_9RHOB|nr:Dabb family protein [Tritonibacter litoralis]MQQ10144.1 Dabb family protein [Tritonibacter litoralis]
MILHCVFCNFKDDVPARDRTAILHQLEQFCGTLDGVFGFEHGPNLDFEQKSPAYDAGFVIRFENVAALHAYAKHPDHVVLGTRLCSLCNGGADGLMVFDLQLP